MLDLFFIAVVVVVIIDLSGFIDSVKSGLKRWATRGRMSDPNYTLKPIDCSTCQIFWFGLLYLIITHQFTLFMLAYVCVLSIMSMVIKEFILLIRNVFLTVLRYFDRKL